MIVDWFKRRKAERERQQFSDGFGWAMAAHYIDHISQRGIERQIDIGADFRGFGEFERGASYALTIIRNSKKYGGGEE